MLSYCSASPTENRSNHSSIFWWQIRSAGFLIPRFPQSTVAPIPFTLISKAPGLGPIFDRHVRCVFGKQSLLEKCAFSSVPRLAIVFYNLVG